MRYRHHRGRRCYRIRCSSGVMRWRMIKSISVPVRSQLLERSISRQNPRGSSPEESEEDRSRRRQLKRRRRRWWRAKGLRISRMRITITTEWHTTAKVLTTICIIKIHIMRFKRIDQRAQCHRTIPTCPLRTTIMSSSNIKRIYWSFWANLPVHIRSSRAPTSSRDSWSMISLIMTEW